MYKRLMILSNQSLSGVQAVKLKNRRPDGLGAGHAQVLLARLYGYSSYHDLEVASRVANGYVQNLRYDQPAIIPDDDLLSVSDAVKAAFKKPEKSSSSTNNPNVNPNKMVKSQVGMRMGGLAAKDMAVVVRYFCSQFRTSWLFGDRQELRDIAVKRFYGLEKANDLAPYLKLRIFPKGFHPDRILKSELGLAKHLATRELRDKRWTAQTVCEHLRSWCKDQDVENELFRLVGELAGGKPHRFAELYRRNYGVVLLILDQDAGVGIITENNKIVGFSRLIKKAHKVKRSYRAPQREPKDDLELQPPAHYEAPRIVLTSHEPGMQSAFRDLNKRNS
jgi:hypothetical protein